MSETISDEGVIAVLITFNDDSVLGYRRLGGQADVQIYTGNN